MLKNAVNRDLEARASSTYRPPGCPRVLRSPGASPAAGPPQPSRIVDAAAVATSTTRSAPPPATAPVPSSPSVGKAASAPCRRRHPLGATVEQMRAPARAGSGDPARFGAPSAGARRPQSAASVPPPMELAYGPARRRRSCRRRAPIATAPAPAVRPPRAKSSVPLVVVASRCAITVLLVGVALVLNEFAR